MSNLAITTARFQTASRLKKVTFKKETTGECFVSFELETDNANLIKKHDVNSLDVTNSVGIDLGIPNYIHTGDEKTVDWLDPEDTYERLQREQRDSHGKRKDQYFTKPLS